MASEFQFVHFRTRPPVAKRIEAMTMYKMPFAPFEEAILLEEDGDRAAISSLSVTV